MMLVLSRKQGETIQIDDNIFVTVSEVKGGRVRLSIDAPRSVRIARKEIVERDAKEERPARQPPIALRLPAVAIPNCLN